MGKSFKDRHKDDYYDDEYRLDHDPHLDYIKRREVVASQHNREMRKSRKQLHIDGE